MQIEVVPIEQVIPYARNPRNNSRAIAKVAASIKEFGWQQPIVVDEQMVVIVGHTRLEGARQLGLTEVPIHKAVGLSAEQAKAYRIADNKTGELAEWDHDFLALELQDLRAADYPLVQTGFELQQIDTMLSPVDLDSDDEPLSPRAPVHRQTDLTITIGKTRIPITPAELERGLKRVGDYLDEKGTLYGFAASLLGLTVLPVAAHEGLGEEEVTEEAAA